MSTSKNFLAAVALVAGLMSSSFAATAVAGGQGGGSCHSGGYCGGGHYGSCGYRYGCGYYGGHGCCYAVGYCGSLRQRLLRQLLPVRWLRLVSRSRSRWAAVPAGIANHDDVAAWQYYSLILVHATLRAVAEYEKNAQTSGRVDPIAQGLTALGFFCAAKIIADKPGPAKPSIRPLRASRPHPRSEANFFPGRATWKNATRD